MFILDYDNPIESEMKLITTLNSQLIQHQRMK
jgi:hypothetical protein